MKLTTQFTKDPIYQVAIKKVGTTETVAVVKEPLDAEKLVQAYNGADDLRIALGLALGLLQSGIDIVNEGKMPEISQGFLDMVGELAEIRDKAVVIEKAEFGPEDEELLKELGVA